MQPFALTPTETRPPPTRVFSTVPTTLAGVRAKIDFALSVDHVTECLRNGYDELLGDFLETMCESARLTAGYSA
jgi:hypothetical protein